MSIARTELLIIEGDQILPARERDIGGEKDLKHKHVKIMTVY